MKNHKLLIVSELFYPEGGGAEYATYLILKLLSKNITNITVVTGTKKPVSIEGIKFYYTNLLTSSPRIKLLLNMLVLRRKNWFRNLLKYHNILYVPLYAYPLIPIAKKKGLKVIVHMHNYAPISYHGVKYYFEPDKLTSLQEIKLGIFHEIHANRSIFRAILLPISYMVYQLFKKWLEQADVIICVSNRQAELVKLRTPKLANKIKIIYNPLPELPVINKEIDNRKIFLYIGGRSFIKGYHILLQAIKKLSKSINNDNNFIFEFILIGNGFSKPLKFNIHNNIVVNIKGYVPKMQMIELYKNSLALLFPSICEEPLPYAVIEAMTLETIPIASKIGGVPEIINNTYTEKFLFTPGNAEELTKKIEDIAHLTVRQVLDINANIREEISRKFNKTCHDFINILYRSLKQDKAEDE